MNPKLTVLYREMPWLMVLDEQIDGASVIKVKRLDATSITHWTGFSKMGYGSYWIKGYFFDERGRIISPIVPAAPTTISGWMKKTLEFLRFTLGGGRLNYTSVEKELTRCSVRDTVRYVVLFGHNDLQHSLCVYKMPQGVTASELLNSIERERAAEAAKMLQDAAIELSEEMAQE